MNKRFLTLSIPGTLVLFMNEYCKNVLGAWLVQSDKLSNYYKCQLLYKVRPLAGLIEVHMLHPMSSYWQ